MKKILYLFFICTFLQPAHGKQDFITIKVKKGETLTIIARKHLQDPRKWRELLRYNKIKSPNLIFPGLLLKVPGSLSRRAVASVVYKVNPSDYLRKLTKKWNRVFVNLPLFSGDSIRTGSRSKLELSIQGRAKLLVKENTFLVITENIGIKKKSTEIYLKRGRLQTILRKLRKRRSQFLIKTVAAVASVRGTSFFSYVDQDENSAFGCYEGVVAVSAQGKTVVLTKGYSTFVRKGFPPEKPTKLPEAPRVNIKK